MREIKFDIVARNIHFNEVHHTVYTLEQLWEGNLDTWIKSTNCEMFAKREFTGFKDKNDNDIYEGDIVELTLCIERGEDEYYNEEKALVKWEEKYGTWFAGDRRLADYIDDGDWEHWAEVIGNIYEHSELLGKDVA